MNGNEIIDSFEEKWCKWNIDDTIQWFDFVLKCKNSNYKYIDENENYDNCKHLNYVSDSDYEIEDYSSSSDDSYSDEDEKKHEHGDLTSINLNFKNVKIRMEAMEFRAKRDFGLILKPFQFKRYGFKNKNDCKLLFKQTQLLVKKYPKKSQNNGKQLQDKKQHYSSDQRLEGLVHDTSRVCI